MSGVRVPVQTLLRQRSLDAFKDNQEIQASKGSAAISPHAASHVVFQCLLSCYRRHNHDNVHKDVPGQKDKTPGLLAVGMDSSPTISGPTFCSMEVSVPLNVRMVLSEY